jgi:hypothetical protein
MCDCDVFVFVCLCVARCCCIINVCEFGHWPFCGRPAMVLGEGSFASAPTTLFLAGFVWDAIGPLRFSKADLESILNHEHVDISKCYHYLPNIAAANKLAGMLDSLVKRGFAAGKTFKLYVRPLCPGSLRKHMSLREVPVTANAIVDISRLLGSSGMCNKFRDTFAEAARTWAISFPSLTHVCLCLGDFMKSTILSVTPGGPGQAQIHLAQAPRALPEALGHGDLVPTGPVPAAEVWGLCPRAAFWRPFWPPEGCAGNNSPHFGVCTGFVGTKLSSPHTPVPRGVPTDSSTEAVRGGLGPARGPRA